MLLDKTLLHAAKVNTPLLSQLYQIKTIYTYIYINKTVYNVLLVNHIFTGNVLRIKGCTLNIFVCQGIAINGWLPDFPNQ